MEKSKCDICGHGYAVMHYFTGGDIDDITCSVCGDQLVFSYEIGWWITKDSASAENSKGKA